MERIGLRQDFGEDQDHKGHRNGGIGDAGIAEQADQNAGGKG